MISSLIVIKLIQGIILKGLALISRFFMLQQMNLALKSHKIIIHVELCLWTLRCLEIHISLLDLSRQRECTIQNLIWTTIIAFLAHISDSIISILKISLIVIQTKVITQVVGIRTMISFVKIWIHTYVFWVMKQMLGLI